MGVEGPTGTEPVRHTEKPDAVAPAEVEMAPGFATRCEAEAEAWVESTVARCVEPRLVEQGAVVETAADCVLGMWTTAATGRPPTPDGLSLRSRGSGA